MCGSQWRVLWVLSVCSTLVGCDGRPEGTTEPSNDTAANERRSAADSARSIPGLYRRMAGLYGKVDRSRFSRRLREQMAHMAWSHRSGRMQEISRVTPATRAGGPPASGGLYRRTLAAMAGWHAELAERNAKRAREREGERERTYRTLAKMHRRMASRLGAAKGASVGNRNAAGPRAVDGARLYAQVCAACHGFRGEGVWGAFPPLAGSAIVKGEKRRLIRIVRDGTVGALRVRDRTYDGVMPAFGDSLTASEIAAVVTRIRRSWGHEGSAVTAEEVRKAEEREGS